MRRRNRAVDSLRFAAFALALRAAVAHAQPAPPPDGIAVGDFWFRPRLELRLRAEYYHHPVSTSGDVPVVGSELDLPFDVKHQWVVLERSRIGLGAEHGPLAAAVVVQDARVAGVPSAAGAVAGTGPTTTSFHVAYVEAHSAETHPSFARVGRQEIAWGDGRLLGTSDWMLVPRSLDAVRARWVVRQFDVEAMAALLAPPGAVPPEASPQVAPSNGLDSGTGAQLYGLQASVHLDPLLHAEITGLGRVVRSPTPAALAPGDTVVVDGRIFGDRAGLRYAAEFAYELGRWAIVGGNRDLRAWAATAHAEWQSGWPMHPKFVVGGSYATGDDANASGTSHRFDPMLPDARAGLGQMGLYAWSNVFDAAASVTLAPIDEVSLAVGYRYVRLADPRGAWFAASLLPVGQNLANDAGFLGQEIDLAASYTPFDALVFTAGYGAFVTGQGARAILSGRTNAGPSLLSAAFVQASFAAP
jgi:hypothetical protein